MSPSKRVLCMRQCRKFSRCWALSSCLRARRVCVRADIALLGRDVFSLSHDGKNKFQAESGPSQCDLDWFQRTGNLVTQDLPQNWLEVILCIFFIPCHTMKCDLMGRAPMGDSKCPQISYELYLILNTTSGGKKIGIYWIFLRYMNFSWMRKFQHLLALHWVIGMCLSQVNLLEKIICIAFFFLGARSSMTSWSFLRAGWSLGTVSL